MALLEDLNTVAPGSVYPTENPNLAPVTGQDSSAYFTGITDFFKGLPDILTKGAETIGGLAGSIGSAWEKLSGLFGGGKDNTQQQQQPPPTTLPMVAGLSPTTWLLIGGVLVVAYLVFRK